MMNPFTVQMLRDDWANNPDLTETQKEILSSIPDDTLREVLSSSFIHQEDAWFALMDSVLWTATRELLSTVDHEDA